jgi:2-phosphosulfolactate phosphatase
MAELINVDVFFTSQSLQEDTLRGKTAVVIDVLRASSTITTALSNGARQIIPVEDMGEASKLQRTIDSDAYLLCGEKDGKKIDGYDYGNSPLEYTKEAVEDKTIIFNTTNGTKAIKKTGVALQSYIASFLNMAAVAEKLASHDNEIVLICAGWKGRISFEDSLLAGALIHSLGNGELPQNAKDGAKVAFGLFEKYGDDISGIVKQSDHAQRLKSLVSEEEIEYCCQLNKFDIVPEYRDGIISI